MLRFLGYVMIVLCLISFTLPYGYAGQIGNYPATSTLQNGDIVPVVIVASNTNGTINWSNLKVIMTQGINWSALPNVVQNFNLNWTDMQRVQQAYSDVNWTFLNHFNGGLNWYSIANNAPSANLMCWKSNGQPGKCTSAISGVNCTSCN